VYEGKINMNRRGFLKRVTDSGMAFYAGSLLPNTAAVAASSASEILPDTKPNIIFILLDDLGWGDLGCYGNTIVKTPNIDNLAAQGCRFTDFYVSMPMCSPTRAAFITGRNPNRFGFRHVINEGIVNPNVAVPEIHHLPIEEPSFPRQLRQVGYRTGTVGKWHLSLTQHPSEPKPDDYGFDYYCLAGGNSLYHGPAKWNRNGQTVEIGKDFWFPSVYVDESIRFIEQDRTKPFYLSFWPFSPHVKEECEEKYRSLYEGRTEQEKTYYGCVTQIDEQIGRLFEYLKKNGLWNNTIVIFASDNGPEPPVNIFHHSEARRGSTGPFRGSKHVIYEGGIRVPGIIRWPGLSTPGSISSIPVSDVDILPTLCAAVAAPIPKSWQYDGTDFRPALQNKPLDRPHPLYWECAYSMKTFVGPHFFSQPLALREGSWKLMCDMDFQNPTLYNLDWDKGEKFTVDKEYPDIVENMMQKLKNIHDEINSPYSKSAKFLNPVILDERQKKKQKN
jgi:arylsulfatase A